MNVWCVRAEYGTYTRNFVDGGFIGIGWIPKTDLSKIHSRDQLYPIYQQEHPNDTSNIVIGQQVGQIARFLLEIKAGDYVVTPASNTEFLHFGQVENDPSYFYSDGADGCPYHHRRKIKWAEKTLNRSQFSVPFQNTIRSSLTVFAISQRDEFLAAVGRSDAVEVPREARYDPVQAVLEQVLQLDDKEFEILVGHLLTALGFEGSEVVGKSGDGGVDATGELNVSNLAKIKVFVQAKRYKIDARISGSTVRQLRQAIPVNAQGAFITTADFRSDAAEVALEPGFPRIGLINGRQLVDLLVEYWAEIPQVFRERLGLKPGLVRA